jgi:hypothetical protein
MAERIDMDAAYMPSENVVAREIEGELILVPIASGVGDMEDELYTLNDSGKAIWRNLNDTRSMKSLIRLLSEEYDALEDEIEVDVTGLLSELLLRNMVVKVDLA